MNRFAFTTGVAVALLALAGCNGAPGTGRNDGALGNGANNTNGALNNGANGANNALGNGANGSANRAPGGTTNGPTGGASNTAPGAAHSNVAQGAAPSFDAADANNDGVLTPQEASGIPGLDFSQMDADHNNAVTRQEYDNAMARSHPGG